MQKGEDKGGCEERLLLHDFLDTLFLFLAVAAELANILLWCFF